MERPDPKRTAIAGALHFLAVARRELDKAGLAALLRAQFPVRTDA